MSEGIFENVNFSLARQIQDLGAREKNTLKTVLLELCEMQQTDKKLGVTIRISKENPFNSDDFFIILRNMGIDSSCARKKEVVGDEVAISFLPKLYDNQDSKYTKGIIASEETTKHFIESFIDHKPSPINPKPKK